MNTKQVNKILKGVKCSRSPLTAVAFMFRTKLERVNVFSYTVHNNER
jgi:hypothetical protein